MSIASLVATAAGAVLAGLAGAELRRWTALRPLLLPAERLTQRRGPRA